MTKKQKSINTLERLLSPCLGNIREVKRDCELVSLIDIRKVYKAFNMKPEYKDKEMLIGVLRGLFYSDIEEKIYETLEGQK